MHLHIKDDTVIDVLVQSEIRDACYQIVERPCPFVFTTGEFITLTKEALEISAMIENVEPVSAYVTVAPELAQRMVADHYFSTTKVSKPTKIVQRIEDAIDWMRENELI